MMLVIIAGFTAMAQDTEGDTPEHKGYFGIRLGAELTCPGEISSGNISMTAFKCGSGVEFGGIYNYPLSSRFCIEPGVMLFYNSYSLIDSYLKNISGGYNIKSVTMKKFGMRVPVRIGYHFDLKNDIKLHIFLGPELEIGLSGKECVKNKSNVEVSESYYGADGGMNRVNLLMCLGVGITYRQYYFGINEGLGMLNMFKNSNEKFHENNVVFSLGYNF